MSTALHGAVVMNSPRILNKLLAQEGILFNEVDKYQRTPLDYAISRGAKECAEILENAGAKSGKSK